MVPSTTQNPCWTLVTSTTATARARPTAPRRALRNHTERNGEVGEQPVGEAVRRWTRLPSPKRRSTTGSGARRLEGRIGHHLGGDPQRPHVEPGIERGGDAAVLARRGGCGSRSRSGGRGVGLGEGGDVGGQVGARSARRASRVESCTALIRAGSWTGWPSPSQIRDAAWWQRLGHLRGDGPGGRPFGRPVLVAEHGRVPGDPLDPAHELGERDGTGGGAGRRVGRARNCRRRSASCAVTSASAPGSAVPRARASARRATAETAADEAAPEVVVPGRRPDEKAGGDAAGGRQRPPQEAGPDLRGRLRHRDGEHERQQGGRRRRRRRRRRRCRRRARRSRPRPSSRPRRPCGSRPPCPSTMKQLPARKRPT